MITVLIVDDHRLVRAGLKRILLEQPDIRVVAEADSGEQGIELAAAERPDVILMDINMPGIGGLEATRRALRRSPRSRIIGLSMHVEDPFPRRILAAGASGYISKNSAAEEVVNAIRRVQAGEHYLSSTVAGRLATSLAKGDGSPFESLSEREMQVMTMLTQGMTTQEISAELHLSPKTVSTYRYRLFDKLSVSNNVELTRLASRYGLLEDPSGLIG